VARLLLEGRALHHRSAARGDEPPSAPSGSRVLRRKTRSSGTTGIVWLERGGVPIAALASTLAVLLLPSCARVDPGPNFVVPDEQFDQDYFFCHVEPELLFAKGCGTGDPAAGDKPNGCHFNAAAVSGMPLRAHPAVDCGGGDHPVNRAQLGAGGAAQANLQAASLEMSRDYLTAPIYVRSTGQTHPRAVIGKDDPVVEIIKAWAQK
jgi:hypothetical protein